MCKIRTQGSPLEHFRYRESPEHVNIMLFLNKKCIYSDNVVKRRGRPTTLRPQLNSPPALIIYLDLEKINLTNHYIYIGHIRHGDA